MAASLPEGYSPLYEDQGKPVLANACASVTYRLNQEDVPQGGTETVSKAIRETAELTGLSIVPARTTDNTGLNIEITYLAESQDSNLSGNPIGVTRTQAGSMFGHMTLTQATIVLEDEWFQDAITHDPELAVQVAVHELGHALGLAHVDDPTSIMHPSAGATQPNQTDKQAFRALNTGCNTTAGPRAPEGNH